MPPKAKQPLGPWAKFKNFMTGKTEEERDINRAQERLWHLEKILEWNAEIGRRYFNEDMIREEISEIKKQITHLRRELPQDSRYKTGPWDSFETRNPFYELGAHIGYLRQILYMNRMNSQFPTMKVMIQLGMLEQQMAMMRQAAGLDPLYVVEVGGYYPPQHRAPQGWNPPGWRPPVGPAVPAYSPSTGWTPPPPPPATGGGGWGPPPGPAVPIVNSGGGWGPPSGPAVPIIDSSSSSSGSGWGPPSGGATPMSPWGSGCSGDNTAVQIGGFSSSSRRAGGLKSAAPVLPRRDPRTGRFIKKCLPCRR